MAETKGIVIEFKGNTVEFDKSLTSINNGLKALKNEAKNINTQLKLDPQNVEALNNKFKNLKNTQQLLTEQVDLYKSELANMSEVDIGTKKWLALQNKLSSAEIQLEKVSKELKEFPNIKIENLANKFKDVEKQLDTVSKKLENVGKTLNVLSGAVIGMGAVGIGYNAQIEQYETALTNLTGSAEEAREVLQGIKDDAKTSAFSTANLIEANNLLISAGVNGSESRDVINALGNAISATGGGNAELSRMAQNLQQIKNVGKASSVDIKQFAMAGINIYGLLADTTGKTVEEVQKLDVSYEMVRDALIQASQEGGRYAGAMEAQSQTLTGSVTKLKDSITELLGELTESLMPIIKDLVAYVNDMVKALKKIDPQTKKTIASVGVVIASLGPLVTIIAKVIGGVGSVSGAIGGLLSWIAKVTGTTPILTTALGTLKDMFSSISSPILVVIGVLTTLFLTNEKFRNAVIELAKSLLNTLKPAFSAIQSVIQLVTNVVNLVVNAFLTLFGFGNRATIFGETLKGVFTIINKLLEGTFGVISKVVDAFNWLIGKANDFLLVNDKVIRSGQITQSYSKSGKSINTLNSGGLGLASGGIGLTMDIHIDNNGTPIDENEVNRWADVMLDRLDLAFGRRL